MLETTKGSWLIKYPAYLSFFFAFNGFSFASGAMDSMIPMMMGTTEEWLPIITGPFGDFCFISNSIANMGIGFLWLELIKTGDLRTAFTIFMIVLAAWIPLLGFMFVNGIMGVPGVAQYALTPPRTHARLQPVSLRIA